MKISLQLLGLGLNEESHSDTSFCRRQTFLRLGTFLPMGGLLSRIHQPLINFKIRHLYGEPQPLATPLETPWCDSVPLVKRSPDSRGSGCSPHSLDRLPPACTCASRSHRGAHRSPALGHSVLLLSYHRGITVATLYRNPPLLGTHQLRSARLS